MTQEMFVWSSDDVKNTFSILLSLYGVIAKDMLRLLFIFVPLAMPIVVIFFRNGPNDAARVSGSDDVTGNVASYDGA